MCAIQVYEPWSQYWEGDFDPHEWGGVGATEVGTGEGECNPGVWTTEPVLREVDLGSHMRGAVSEGAVIPGMLVDSPLELEAEGMGPSGELEARPTASARPLIWDRLLPYPALATSTK